MVSVTLKNPVVASLDIRPTDRVISIKESGSADSNFVITHLIKQIFQEKGSLCLVILHNTLGHYHNVGKRLGYDFPKHAEEGRVKTVEPLKSLVEDIGSDSSAYFRKDKEEVARDLFADVKRAVQELAAKAPDRVYLIVDDISHLLDLGIDLKYVISFINSCLGLVNDGKVSVVINTHVCGKSDEIICNNLNYISDVTVEVLPLATGFSKDVTGMMTVEKSGGSRPARYHFKAYDKGIRTFSLGESVRSLYK